MTAGEDRDEAFGKGVRLDERTIQIDAEGHKVRLGKVVIGPFDEEAHCIRWHRRMHPNIPVSGFRNAVGEHHPAAIVLLEIEKATAG